MKMLSKVVWTEGMYLAPHHFQAQNRYYEETVHLATSTLWQNSYGLIDYRLNRDAIRNGTVTLEYARGIFEDGLPFDMPDSDSPPEPCELRDRFPHDADELVVYLAIPRRLPDGGNCSTDGASKEHSRFKSVASVLADENTGRDEKPIQLGQKNIRFALPAEVSDREVTLPIARVRRDGANRFSYDTNFVPPVLSIVANERLVGIVSRLVEVLEDRSYTLAQDRPISRGGFKAGVSGRHVSQFWFLHAVNSGLTSLRHLLLAKHGHPQELFLEMARLAGALCTFSLDTHPGMLPSYDHNNPGPGFELLDQHIRRMLEVVLPTQTVSIPLTKAEQYFYEGDVKDARCFGKSRWLLGINSQIGEADLISRTEDLVKICSAKFVPELVRRALPGLALTHLEVPPSAISVSIGTQYFVINRSGPCWEHIQVTGRIGVYVPSEIPSPELEVIVALEG